MTADRRRDHGRYDELTAGYALDALDPQDEADCGAHLPDCDRCQDAVARFTEITAALAQAAPAAEPSPALGPRIMAAVAREPGAGAPRRSFEAGPARSYGAGAALSYEAGPVRSDEAGPVRSDEAGSARSDKAGPGRPDEAGPGRSDEPAPAAGAAFSPVGRDGRAARCGSSPPGWRPPPR